MTIQREPAFTVVVEPGTGRIVKLQFSESSQRRRLYGPDTQPRRLISAKSHTLASRQSRIIVS